MTSKEKLIMAQYDKEVKEAFERWSDEGLQLFPISQPTVDTADFVRVVRCKDCKWFTQFRNIKGELFPEGECEGWGFTKPNDFCSRGERKDEVEE